MPLRAFEAVGRHLSFTAAANSLYVTQSAVSRHVITLERLLGVQLFDRRPHQLVLTEAGRALLPAVTKSFDRLEHVLDDIVAGDNRPGRALRLTMPPSFAHYLAVPILRDFRRECPDIVLDIESRYQPGPAMRDIDLAVAYAKPQVTDLVRDLLWTVRQTPLCHPGIAADAGPDLAAFLARNELLHVRLEGEPRHHFWERFARAQNLPSLRVDRGLVFDAAHFAARYAESGEGVALLDPVLVDEALRAGRLVQPFPVWLDEGFGYWLTLHPEDLGDEAIALLRAWLIRRFATAPARPPAPVRASATEG